jgi:hypothetical protein
MALVFSILTYILLFSSCIYRNFFVCDFIDYLHALFIAKNSFFEYTLKSFFVRPFELRPLYGVVNYLCFKFSSVNPSGFIIYQMLVSIICIFVIYLIVKNLSQDKMLIYLVPFLFAIHPIHYRILLPGSTDVTSMLLFLFLSFLMYILSLKKKSRFFYILSLISYPIAMLFYEGAITLPLFILAYHAIFDRSRNIIKSLGFWIVMFLYLVVRFYLLGLWISNQHNYAYDFLNMPNIIFVYKIFLAMSREMLTYTFYCRNKLLSLPLFYYFTGLVAAVTGVIITTKSNKGNGSVYNFRNWMKLLILGLLSYFIGLLPFVFMINHCELHYLFISTFGLAITVSVLIRLLYMLLCYMNIWLAKTITCLVLLFFLLSAVLVVTDNTDNTIFNIVYVGRNTRSIIQQIKTLYPAFPDNSQIYLIGFDGVLRVDTGFRVFYNRPDLKFVYLENDAGLSDKIKNNFYVLKLSGDGYSACCKDYREKVSDLTKLYKK